MPAQRDSGRQRRPAFTLVEMLVVMAIITLIATITALVVPNVLRNQKVTQGANLLQGMLLAAKQRAVREQTPAGVRFIVAKDPLYPQRIVCTEMIYVVQPDDLVIASDTLQLSASSPYTATSSTQDFSGGLTVSAAAADQFTVQAGDYLELSGGGPVTAIQKVAVGSTPAGNTKYNQLQTYSNPSVSSSVTGYRVIRGPRRVPGEDSIKLPQDVVVVFDDATSGANVSYSQYIPKRPVSLGLSTTVFYEILFAPSGSVIGQGTSSTDKIVLFVWDGGREQYTEGEPALVVVNALTGAISVQAVDLRSGNYYTFAQDPRLSGM